MQQPLELVVLHVLNDVRQAGTGITNMVVDLTTAQARLGLSVIVASAGGEYVSLLENNGVVHHHLDQRRTATNIVRARQAMDRIVASAKVDIVHVHTMTGAVLARLSKARTGVPVVSTMHNPYQRGSSLMLLANRCVVISDAGEARLRRRGARKRRLGNVANGLVGSPRLAAPEKQDLPGLSVVAVGSVCERKGSDVLVAAFADVAARYPQAHLYFVGNIDWTVPVDLAAASHCDERIHFAGFQRRPGDYVSAADVLVQASRDEPFGLAILEARALSVPVIGTDVGGIPQALDGGSAGLIIPAGDARAMSTALSCVLGDHELRTRMRRASGANLEWATAERMARDYARVYSQVRTEGVTRWWHRKAT